MKTNIEKEYKKPQVISSSDILKEQSVQLAGYVPATTILIKNEMRKKQISGNY